MADLIEKFGVVARCIVPGEALFCSMRASHLEFAAYRLDSGSGINARGMFRDRSGNAHYALETAGVLRCCLQ